MTDPKKPLMAGHPASVCDLQAALCLHQLTNEDATSFYSRCTDQLNQFWSHRKNTAEAAAAPVLRKQMEAEVEAKNYLLKVVFASGLRQAIRDKLPTMFSNLRKRGQCPDLLMIIQSTPVSMLADAATIAEDNINRVLCSFKVMP